MRGGLAAQRPPCPYVWERTETCRFAHKLSEERSSAERTSSRGARSVSRTSTVMVTRLAVRFNIKESMSAKVDVEAFNLFNHVNFAAVGQQQMFSISGANLNFTLSFGVPTAGGNTLINSRQMQFGAKFTF